MTKAQELLAIVSKGARSIFKEFGEVMPFLHAVDEFNNHIPIHFAGGFENAEAKDVTADVMRKALIAANAQRYALVMEAWSTHPSDGERAMKWKKETGKSLEDFPDRIEVISIFVEDRNTKESLARTYRILRPEHGKATLSPPQDHDQRGKAADDRTGRFNNLFEPESK